MYMYCRYGTLVYDCILSEWSWCYPYFDLPLTWSPVSISPYFYLYASSPNREKVGHRNIPKCSWFESLQLRKGNKWPQYEIHSVCMWLQNMQLWKKVVYKLNQGNEKFPSFPTPVRSGMWKASWPTTLLSLGRSNLRSRNVLIEGMWDRAMEGLSVIYVEKRCVTVFLKTSVGVDMNSRCHDKKVGWFTRSRNWEVEISQGWRKEEEPPPPKWSCSKPSSLSS